MYSDIPQRSVSVVLVKISISRFFSNTNCKYKRQVVNHAKQRRLFVQSMYKRQSSFGLLKPFFCIVLYVKNLLIDDRVVGKGGSQRVVEQRYKWFDDKKDGET